MAPLVQGFEIKPGRYVKITNSFQRFWVKLIAVYTDKLVGEVNNPIDERFGYGYGDCIQFSVLDIVPDD
jgi:hypothetical protein